jgi:hypothetical protein
MKTYPAGVVAVATGTSLPTLQRYRQQGHIDFQPCDVASAGSGEKCGYSARRVFQVALITELSHISIGPSRAAKAAFEFSDKGNTGRPVGELYPRGTTFLVGLPRGENRVVNVPPDLSIADVLSSDATAFIINCNSVIERVTNKLDKL